MVPLIWYISEHLLNEQKHLQILLHFILMLRASSLYRNPTAFSKASSTWITRTCSGAGGPESAISLISNQSTSKPEFVSGENLEVEVVFTVSTADRIKLSNFAFKNSKPPVNCSFTVYGPYPYKYHSRRIFHFSPLILDSDTR